MNIIVPSIEVQFVFPILKKNILKSLGLGKLGKSRCLLSVFQF